MPTLGKYALIQQLGTGSMGTVYLARDTVLDREVALKTIRTGDDVEPEVKERFYREARTCARLQHPSIVTIFDLGEQDNIAYIAMELLAGSDFRRVIEGRPQVDLAVKIDAMIQVCEALAYAHQQGIVHRDVKPSNLFLALDNRAKVLDFGIARLPSSRLTVVGRVLGTPNYMSPEQILGKRSDGRSDLFSVAVVFFELLVGQHPFRSALIPRRIVDGEPDSIFDHDSSVPLPLESVFARGLAKDPDRRYATGGELAADLRAILDGLQQNSSPRFSRFALPSLRAPVATRPSETPILNPSGSGDPQEWKMSEFLRVLPGFESAVERGDRVSAEKTMVQLQTIAGYDAHFTESLRICEEKILQIFPAVTSLRATDSFGEAAGQGLRDNEPVEEEGFTQWLRHAISATEKPNADVPSAQSVPRDGDALCDGCGARNRGEAAFCIDCGARMPKPDPARALTAPLAIVDQEVQDLRHRTGTPALRPKRIRGWGTALSNGAMIRFHALWKEWYRPGLSARLDPKVLFASAFGFALLVAIVLSLTRSIPIEAYVATGRIRTPGTPVLKTINNSKTIISLLGSGTRVNLLKQPIFSGQGWFLVQPIIEGKALAKGYVKRDSVGDWDTARADIALTLVLNPDASQNFSDADVKRKIGDLDRVLNRFSGTPQARTAAIAEAALLVEVSKREQREGRAGPEWNNRLDQARLILTALRPDAETTAMLRDVDTMLGPSPELLAQAEPLKAPAESASIPDLTKARDLLKNYDYNGALVVLRSYLAIHPDDKEAGELRRKALEQKRAEEQTLR